MRETTISYKEAITREMTALGKKKNTVFLGENIINSGRIYGTLDKVSIKRCIEMPVAENLIAGAAIGLAIAGYRPICIFQRMDFMLIAADQIINHAALIPKMSGGSIKLPIIFRTIKGKLNDGFWVGYQHSKDLTYVFQPHMLIYNVPGYCDTALAYELAYEHREPVLVVEDYASYNKQKKKRR